MRRRLRLDIVLTIIGLVLLGYVGETLLEGRVRQAIGERRLERAWSAPAASRAVKATAPKPSPGDLLGRLEIPRLGMSALIAEGDSEATLRTSIGHLAETPLPGQPGNVALAGHRDTIFRALRQIEIGDRITVHSWEGQTEYEVTDKHVVGPEDVSVLAPSEVPILTLITCYPFSYIGPAPKRFVVQARQIDAGSPAAPTNLSGKVETRSSAAGPRRAGAA
jgi:LPXTG-site transpeptidase (sortase) family protein